MVKKRTKTELLTYLDSLLTPDFFAAQGVDEYVSKSNSFFFDSPIIDTPKQPNNPETNEYTPLLSSDEPYTKPHDVEPIGSQTAPATPTSCDLSAQSLTAENNPPKATSQGGITDENDEPVKAQASVLQKINILKKIERLSNVNSSSPDEKDKEKIVLAAKFFTPFVSDPNRPLTMIYPTLRAKLKKDLANAEKIHADEFADTVGDLLVLIFLLNNIPDSDPDVLQAKEGFTRDFKIYKQLWADMSLDPVLLEGITWHLAPKAPSVSSQTIQDIHPEVNPFRLFLIRLNRVFLALQPLLKQYEDYHQMISNIESGGLLQFFSYLWLFFVLRFLTNIWLITSHLFFPEKGIEAALDWHVRLFGQIIKRWNAVVNDAGWLSSGITNCFFLAGKTPVIGVYLAVAMQGYDLLNSSMSFYVEMCRFCSIIKRYMETNSLSEQDDFIAYLELRRAFEWKIHAWTVFNFCILLTCACLMATATNPIIPVIAAVIAVLITIVHYGVTQHVNHRRRTEWGQNAPLVSCGYITMSEPPTENTDLGVFSKLYIRVKYEDGKNGLFFIEKAKPKGWLDRLYGKNNMPSRPKPIDLVEKYTLQPEHFDAFDEILDDTKQKKTITNRQLKKINEISSLSELMSDVNTDITFIRPPSFSNGLKGAH